MRWRFAQALAAWHAPPARLISARMSGPSPNPPSQSGASAAAGPAIFISYRRRDADYAVDRLDERLRHAFGTQAVFRDTRSLEKGQAFPDNIRRALDEVTLGLVIIGPHWLEPDAATGKPRLHDAQDWVRLEVETLLARTLPSGQPLPVLPVFLGDTRMPSARELPASLAALPTRNGLALRSAEDFEDSVRQLIEHVGKILGRTPQPFADERKYDLSRILHYAPAQLIGRETDLSVLSVGWDRVVRAEPGRPHVLTFVPSAARGKPPSSRSGPPNSRGRTGRGATRPLRGPSTAKARASRWPRVPTCFSRRP